MGAEGISVMCIVSVLICSQRIFKFTLNVLQAMGKLHHVLLSMLLKHLQLDVQSLVSDRTQSLHTHVDGEKREIRTENEVKTVME